MRVIAQIDRRLADLTPAERRAAAVVADDPEAVAFGTVAEVAARAGVSGATVVRLAAKLGYQGFVALQAAVQAEMTGRLRPAAARIREAPPHDALGRTLTVELDNVSATLTGVDPAAFEAAVRLLAGGRPSRSPSSRVLVLSGDASHGIAVVLATELGLLRPGVEQLTGSEVRVARSLAQVRPSDVMVVLDLPRYDRWVLSAAARAAAAGVHLVAVTDSALSPLAGSAEVRLVVAAAGAGPFDSHVGMLALGNALVTGVAARLRRGATERLDRVEAAWRETGALVDS